MLKCCSRFVSFHLFFIESRYCCERQRDLTTNFIVKLQGGEEGGWEGEEKRGKEAEANKPSLETI